LISQKGIDILINAFIRAQNEIPNARLKIIGYGPEETSIRDIIALNNIRDKVEFIKSVPHSNLAEQYRGARVLVLPSVIPEGFGMTPVEAGACGVPTLTFGLGGTSEIVVDCETGIISEIGVDNLAIQLIRIMSDDDLADSMGIAAHNRVLENFSWTVIGEKFDMLFKDIVVEMKNS
jgi:phosphatidylinositol alpha-1,6-mannosyltransferase